MQNKSVSTFISSIFDKPDSTQSVEGLPVSFRRNKKLLQNLLGEWIWHMMLHYQYSYKIY